MCSNMLLDLFHPCCQEKGSARVIMAISSLIKKIKHTLCGNTNIWITNQQFCDYIVV